jgi:HEAT repeat protein
MKNPLGLLAGALLTALSVAAAPAPPDWWEPSYKGKNASQWLDEYGLGPGAYKPNPQADDALRHIGPNAVPDLLQLLHATNPNPATQTPASWDHWKAYLGFQALGPAGKLAIPDLVKLAHDPSDSSDPSGTDHAPNVAFWKDTVRVAQIAAISVTFDAPGQPHKPREMIELRGPFLVDGEIAAWSLAAIGDESVPPLMEMLTNPIPRLRCRAAVALGLMGATAEPAVPVLVRMMNDPVINTRWEVTDALGCIGRRADLAVPALTKALTDPSFDIQNLAVGSLGDFGERAANAIPALLALYPSRDWRINQTVALALCKISPDTAAKQIVPDLLSEPQLPGSRFGGYFNAVVTLGQMKSLPDLVIPALISAADSPELVVRLFASFYLGSFGPAAKSAVPILSSLTNDPDGSVRFAAVRALQQIDPGPAASR